MFSLKGKVAIITGAASGIGFAIMKRFVDAGAQCVVGDLADNPTQAFPENVIYQRTDVTVETEVAALVDKAMNDFGHLDILVNNAGVPSIYVTHEAWESEDFNYCFRVNTMGPAFGIKHAAPKMNEGAAIVTIASLAGLRGSETIGPYVASKHAVVGITKTSALELAPRGIRANCICPSSVMTPMAMAEDGEEFLLKEQKIIPMGRIAHPEEVAALAHFLCADDCSFLTGQAINLSGGMPG